MPWYCNACGRVRGGTECKKVCVEKYGDMGAERVPALDGVVYINHDGSGVPALEKQEYDMNPCRRGVAPPKRVQGPRPTGWFEALGRIGERAARIIEDGVRQGVVLPCGEG